MKILAWLLFGTSVVCFTATFCKQQLENQIAGDSEIFNSPSPQWIEIERNAKADSQLAIAGPTTQPAATAVLHPVVAAGDVSDVLK